MRIIEIKKQDEKDLVSARELYEKLELQWRFSTWINRYIKNDNVYGFIEGEDYTPYVYIHPQNNQEIQDYLLTLDMAKELCMLSKSEKGKELRKYFIDCEKKYMQVMKEQIEKSKNNSLPSLLTEFGKMDYDAHLQLFESILFNLRLKLVREKHEIEEKIRKIDATGLTKPTRVEIEGNRMYIEQDL